MVNDKEQAEKLAAKPNFDHFNIFCEDLIEIHMKKTKLVFDKPVYLGMCILDLSKTLKYDFHYNHIKRLYGNKATLLFTDTDSLMYAIETEDIYKDMTSVCWYTIVGGGTGADWGRVRTTNSIASGSLSFLTPL